MTNIEKVKRILDAGHWVKATSKKFIITITSYNENEFTYLCDGSIHISKYNFDNYTIEVIQRIPKPYVAGEKALVLSNHKKDIAEMQDMVGNVCEIEGNNGIIYAVWNNKKDNFYYFPAYCLAPAFDDDSLSGKEAKIVIDGKEYSVTLKLI